MHDDNFLNHWYIYFSYYFSSSLQFERFFNHLKCCYFVIFLMACPHAGSMCTVCHWWVYSVLWKVFLPWKWPLWLTWNDWIPSEGKLLVLYIDVGSLQLQRPCERSSSGDGMGALQCPGDRDGSSTTLPHCLEPTRVTPVVTHTILAWWANIPVYVSGLREAQKIGFSVGKRYLRGLDLAASFEYVKLQNWLPSPISGAGLTQFTDICHTRPTKKNATLPSERNMQLSAKQNTVSRKVWEMHGRMANSPCRQWASEYQENSRKHPKMWTVWTTKMWRKDTTWEKYNILQIYHQISLLEEDGRLKSVAPNKLKHDGVTHEE